MKSILNKVILFMCIILICLLLNSTVYASIIDESIPSNKNVELYLPGDECIPDNFRKSTDKIPKIKEYKNINTTGLNKLDISGSSQFSYTGLDYIIKSIENKFVIIDIDLRQEAHGFINGSPINWPRTPSNVNSTLEEITEFENSRLDSIEIGKEISYYNLPCKKVTPKEVSNEESLIKDKNLTYIRFPVIDGSIPTEETVNRFINFIENRPKNSWLHFHCKEGIGRTTTFMTMYDIYINGKEVPLNKIIERQIALANMDVDERNSFLSEKREEFLTTFYNKYAK